MHSGSTDEICCENITISLFSVTPGTHSLSFPHHPSLLYAGFCHLLLCFGVQRSPWGLGFSLLHCPWQGGPHAKGWPLWGVNRVVSNCLKTVDFRRNISGFNLSCVHRMQL